MDQYFMNPKTGDVKSADDWMRSSMIPHYMTKHMPSFARWAAINLIEVREPLTENEFDVYGHWVPASVDDNNYGDDQ